jgi:hypothetical protein
MPPAGDVVPESTRGNEVSGAVDPPFRVPSGNKRTPMATRNDRPDRLDVYLVSFVTWSRRDGEKGERRRDLDERWFGGSGPSEAGACAVRWAKEASWLGWIVESVEVVATHYVFTLERCALCGKLRRTEEGPRVLCLCRGLPCEACGRRAIWRPSSDYYDEEEGSFWHVPHFAARRWCASCEKACHEGRTRPAS